MKYIELPDYEIVDLYNKNYSITKIANIFNVSRETISLRLNKNNIVIRPTGSQLRKYPLNESYFNDINSEDKAYFLGLLYADGCNHFNDQKKKVSIDLQEGDKEILSIFSNYLYNGNEFLQFIKGRNGGKNQFRLTLHSKIISQKLNDLGCVPIKSLILKWPEWLIDLDLQKHFIRGYFDGDGSASKYEKNNGWDYQWSMISTKMFCQNVSNIINSSLKIHVCSKMTCENDITETIYVRGNRQILRLMDWLYKDATIYLQRKYDKYQELKDWTDSVDQKTTRYIDKTNIL